YTWITPIAISDVAPHPLYLAAQVLFRSLDRGAHWDTISPDLSGRRAGAGAAAEGPAPGAGCDGDPDPPAARDCGYGVIFSLALSPRDNDEIWAGTDDGRVHLTRDAGRGWREVTPPGVPVWGKIASIDLGPASGSAYVAVDTHRRDDFSPRAFRT